MKTRQTLLLILGVLAALMQGAAAQPRQHMPIGATAVAPAGFIEFCVNHPADCLTNGVNPVAVSLTAERLHDLEEVQATVNRAITPREDPAHRWEYAKDGYGDCNKFALEKRRELLQRGWPKESLLLTVAITEHGEGHLVLVVRTEEEDLVLDNRVNAVVGWAALPYQWLVRQSYQNPLQWVKIADTTKVAQVGGDQGVRMQ